MLILGLQGEDYISKVISVMAYTSIREARASAHWPQEWGAGVLLSSLPILLSCWSSLFTMFCNTVFIFGRFWEFAASPTLKAGSSRNNILRMGWDLKEMLKGQLALRSTDPIGPAGLASLLPLDAFATRSTAHCQAVTCPREHSGLPGGSPLCAVS